MKTIVFFLVFLILLCSPASALIELTPFWKLIDNILTYVGDVKIDGDVYLQGDMLEVNTTIININTTNMDVSGNLTANCANFGNDTLYVDCVNKRVGVGTTSPQAKLEVMGTHDNHLEVGGIGQAGNIGFNRESDGSTVGRIGFQDATGAGGRTQFVIKSTGGGGHIGFWTNDGSGGTEKVRIISDGKVGIGTTSPSSNLQVEKDSGVVTISAVRTGGQFVELRAGTDGSSFGYKDTGNFNIGMVNETNEGALDTIVMTFDTSGNVGIGTTSPSEILHIEKDAGKVLLDTETANEQFNLIFGDNGVNKWALYKTTADDLMIYDYEGVGNMVTFKTGGNVGIGTTTPTSKLNVIGDINATGNITAENVFLPQYIYSHTNETIPINGANLWTNVTISQEDSDIKQGISHTYNDNTNHTFTFGMDGVYDIDYDFDMEDTSPSASDIDVAGRLIYANGSEIKGSVFETDITKQGAEVELSHNFLAELSAGDVIVFQFVATDADVQISTHGTFGDYPESASIRIFKIANLP